MPLIIKQLNAKTTFLRRNQVRNLEVILLGGVVFYSEIITRRTDAICSVVTE